MHIPFPMNIIFNFLFFFLLTAIPVSIVYFVFTAKTNGKASLFKPEFISNYAFVLYIFLLLFVTYFRNLPMALSGIVKYGIVKYFSYINLNLVPLDGISALSAHLSHGVPGTLYFLACTVGMSLMFLPLGIGLVAVKNFKPAAAFTLCLFAPAAIELLQLTVRLSSDINDVIFSLPGAMLGVALGVVIRRKFYGSSDIVPASSNN